MKKLLLALALLLPTPAFAGVSCSVPFNLQNGTTADASQVMANYNAIIACLANAAAAGVNTDITALNALTTPLNPSQGGTSVFIGGTAGGTANAQVVTTTSPNTFALTKNYAVVYVASAANTTAATLAANGTTATTILRQQPGLLPAALVGGEIVTGETVIAVYDGTDYELMNPSSINAASLSATGQVLTGGANVNPTVNGNLGSLSGGGTTTINCGLSPLQYFTNAGNQTLAAPGSDGNCAILMTNNSAAGTISFSGFTVNGNTGEALTTTNTNKFLISIVRINGTSTYFIKALQ